jgi:hypothetical protein
VQWDIRWHVVIGRDSFWIAPHVMTYAGVAAAVLLSFGVLGVRTLGGGGVAPVRLLGLSGSRGVHLAAWGMAVTVLAAPIDDLWHRLFGLDVTIWSPPHLLGIFGSIVNSLACLVIAREVYPAASRTGTAALIASGGLLYANLHLIAEPASLVAYRHGGVLFHALAMLSAALLPLALVTTGRLSGVRWAPIGVVLVVILVNQAGHRIGEAGFRWLEPESVIGEEIRTDPDSPVATAWAIASKNGTPPGRTGGPIHVAALLPAAVMAALDVRRRPRAAVVGWAAALVGSLHLLLVARPAFAPLAPPWPLLLAALALTVGAALMSARAARSLSTTLAAGAPAGGRAPRRVPAAARIAPHGR